MPNNIQNNLAFDCDEKRLLQLLNAVKAEEGSDQETKGLGSFDFNKLIPRPSALDIVDGSNTTYGVSLCFTKMNPNAKHYGNPEDKLPEDEVLKLYHDFKEKTRMYGLNPSLTADEIKDMTKYTSEDELLSLGKQAIKNFQEYGAPTWHGWSVNNWGTKWNSYSNSFNEETGILSFQTAWAAPHPIIKKLSELFPDVTIRHEWADEDLGYHCGTRTYLDGEAIMEYLPEGKEALEWALDTWGYNPGDVGLLLNATETDYINVEDDKYELVEFDGKQALFSIERMTRKDIPKGMFCYDIRQSDDLSEYASIERCVRVNHGGTIITKEPIEFEECDHIELTNENTINFLGDFVSLGEYQSGNYDISENTDLTLE